MEINYILFGIYCLLCLTNLVLGLSREKKLLTYPYKRSLKKKRWVIYQPYEKLFLIFLIFMMLFIALRTTDIPDIDVYERQYHLLTKGVFENGYYWISYIASGMNLSFDVFRGVIIIVAILFMYIGISKLGFNRNIVFAIYAIYPFTIDVIQIRNFLAMSLLIYSLHFLNRETRGGCIKFSIVVLLATLVHSISIVFFVLLLANADIVEKKWKKRILLSLFFIAVIFAFLAQSSATVQQIIYQLFSEINESKATFYLSSKMNFGFLVYWLMEVLFLFVAYKVYAEQQSRSLPLSYGRIFWVNLVLAYLFPLLTINVNFYRIYRNMSIYKYSLLGVVMGTKKNATLILIFSIAVIMNFYMNMVATGDIESTFWIFFAK